MARWAWTAAGALAILLSTRAAGQNLPVDLSAVLVGTWQGEIQMATGSYPRTLIVNSLREFDGGTVADAEYGGVGGYFGEDPRVRPVPVTVEAFGKDVILRFTTPEAWPVELSLHPDRRHLFGDLRIAVALGPAWGINPVKLTKSDSPAR
jgi:hypothetical protein